MNLRPCLDEPPLSPREVPADKFDWIKREDSNIVLVVSMQMGPVVRRCGLSEHADNDPEEPGDLWHWRMTL